ERDGGTAIVYDAGKATITPLEGWGTFVGAGSQLGGRILAKYRLPTGDYRIRSYSQTGLSFEDFTVPGDVILFTEQSRGTRSGPYTLVHASALGLVTHYDPRASESNYVAAGFLADELSQEPPR